MSSNEKPPTTAPVPQDAKAKMREALERKHANHAPSAPADPAAVHPHTAPAKPSRNFRRKSGG